jgi:hypothetical protein
MVTLKRAAGELRLTVADDGQGAILDAPIPGSAAGWSNASPNSSAVNSSGRATAGVRPCTESCRRVKARRDLRDVKGPDAGAASPTGATRP